MGDPTDEVVTRVVDALREKYGVENSSDLMVVLPYLRSEMGPIKLSKEAGISFPDMCRVLTMADERKAMKGGKRERRGGMPYQQTSGDATTAAAATFLSQLPGMVKPDPSRSKSRKDPVTTVIELNGVEKRLLQNPPPSKNLADLILEENLKKSVATPTQKSSREWMISLQKWALLKEKLPIGTITWPKMRREQENVSKLDKACKRVKAILQKYKCKYNGKNKILKDDVLMQEMINRINWAKRGKNAQVYRKMKRAKKVIESQLPPRVDDNADVQQVQIDDNTLKFGFHFKAAMDV